MATEGLLDTTWFVDLIRRDPGARALLDDILSGEFIGYYSPVTAMELATGDKYTPAEDTFFRDVFSRLIVADFDLRAAQLAGLFLRPFNEADRKRLEHDAMIGASALSAGLTVYTRNVRDMERFAASAFRY